MLGEALPFYEQVTIYSQDKFIPIQSMDTVTFTDEPIYCFYKGYALYFDQQRTIAFHFNRQKQQAITLCKTAVVNRVKMALTREQQGFLTFEAKGKKVCLDNNTAWKIYWQFAEKGLSSLKNNAV